MLIIINHVLYVRRDENKIKLLSNKTKSLDWCVSILPTWKMNYKNGFPPILSYHLTRV